MDIGSASRPSVDIKYKIGLEGSPPRLRFAIHVTLQIGMGSLIGYIVYVHVAVDVGPIVTVPPLVVN